MHRACDQTFFDFFQAQITLHAVLTTLTALNPNVLVRVGETYHQVPIVQF